MIIEKITVNDIVKNSGVGRQTFYNHFHDKNDLIEYFYSTSVDSIISENLKHKKPWLDSIIDVLAFFHSYRKFFQSAIKENGQLAFINAYYEHTKNAYIRYISCHAGGTISDRMLFQVEFNCNGAVGMVKNWLLNSMDRTPEDLGKDIWDSMPAEMKAFITTSETESRN